MPDSEKRHECPPKDRHNPEEYPVMSDGAGFKLSPQQRRLWSLAQQGGRYTAKCALLFEGDGINSDQIKAALNRVVDRHEILRTTFHHQAGLKTPVQVIHDSLNPAWLAVPDQPDTDTAVTAVFEALEVAPENLSDGPIVRAALVASGRGRSVLAFRMPALCADSASLKNVAADLSAFIAGNPRQEEPLQYADLAAWQNDLLDGSDDDAKAGRAFWSSVDLSALCSLKLPLEHHSADSDASRLESCEFQIDASAVRQLSSDQTVSKQAVLLAAWIALLWRLTRQSDLIVGFNTDQRAYDEIKDAVGLFARALPIRSQVSDSIPYVSLASQIARSLVDAAKWSDYFDLDHAGGEGAAFFPFGFELHCLPDCMPAGGLSMSIITLETRMERFHLSLSCSARQTAYAIRLNYDTGRIESAEARRIAARLEVLLNCALTQPETPIGALAVLPAEERNQLLVDWNRTTTNVGDPRPLHALFQDQAARVPDSIAVQYEEQRLTYSELNRRANQLARALSSRGVGADNVVALALERSIEMVVGILGVWKAGGAYLPLDPSLPPERLAYMLRDTTAPVIVTMQALVSSLPETDARILCLDSDSESIASESSDDLEGEAKSENLAYVIYTSGSTGRPKGVEIEHRHLFNYVQGVSQRLRLDECRSFATVSTFAADLGNTALFPSLCLGATLHVIAQERAQDGEAMADYFRLNRVDCLKIVPSHFTALLSCSTPSDVIPLKMLILGGEASSWDLAERIHSLVPGCRIVNHYGPTETTVGVLTYPVDVTRRARYAATIPLGRPLPNTEAYIVDSNLQPQPVGVAGELLIGGAGVGRGYLNSPEPTSENFIQRPPSLTGESEEVADTIENRVYRTGDLARFLPDGNIEFLGRIDQQVKIRGFRIEPGEIESALRTHPGVSEAVVVARQEEGGEKRLVAYVVANHAHASSVTDWREHLQARLPDYMMPAAFVPLNAIPLTGNGKVDRNALPAPEDAVDPQAAFVAPRNAVEEVLAGIWTDVLGIRQVGVHGNFFDLGGHSLRATQVISRVRRDLQVEVAMRDLFNAPTISGLAETLMADPLRRDAVIRTAEMNLQLSALSEEELEALLARERMAVTV